MATRLTCAGAVLIGLFAARADSQPLAADRLEAMMIATGRTGETGPLPLIEERLQVVIDGQHATTTLLQVWGNTTPGQIEGRYRLRPGSGSRVDGFAYWNGEAKIVGEVFERQTARRVYDNVTARRRDPGLLEEDGEGAFAFKVFPIEPRENKRVELRWTKWLDRRAKTVTYRAPLTRSDAEIVVAITGAAKNVRSPTHKLHAEPVAGGVRLRSDGAKVAGELVVEWDVDEPDWTPAAYVHPGSAAGDGWFALSLAAPPLPASAIAPKDVTIVIDRSGSMIGEPLEHAKAAADDMIRLLNANDRVNVVAFSDEVDPLFRTPQRADASTRARAIAFVDHLIDGGGTDIALALKTAIGAQDGTGPERPRVVVFMTDGQSDVEHALAAAKADTGDVRLFTIGLGKDVNKPLLQRLAAGKRGRFTYIDRASAIRTEVGRLAASIARPLLVDVSVDVEGPQAIRIYPRTMPDLFAEDELVVTGRLRGTGTARFVIHGKLGGKPVAFVRTVDVAKAASRPWVGKLWAQSRVDHLLEDISLGGTAPELQNEVLELALAYNFVTPYTAFLAIPESELGAMAGTVAAERERKAKIMARNADAKSLDESGDDDDKPANKAKRGLADRDADAMPDRADADEGEALVVSPAADTASRRHGCAGCATSGGPGAGLVLALAVALILLRRRR